MARNLTREQAINPRNPGRRGQPTLWGQNPHRWARGCRAVSGKKRCRMHGGAPGSGAPKNNRNALKHGLFTRDAIEERKQVQAIIEQSRNLLRDME